MRITVHATTVALAGAALTRHPVWRPLLVANGVVGFLYVMRERRALREQGVPLPLDAYGVRVHLSDEAHSGLNWLLHVALTAWALRRLRRGPTPWTAALAIETAGMCFIDFDRAYPSEQGMAAYVALHAVLVLGLCAADHVR